MPSLVCSLRFANVDNYFPRLLVSQAWDRRHITEVPMILPHAVLNCSIEGVIIKVFGVVDYQRRSFGRAASRFTVTGSAPFLVKSASLPS